MNMKASKPALGLALIYLKGRCVEDGEDCWCNPSLYGGAEGVAGAAGGNNGHSCSRMKERRPGNNNCGYPVAHGIRS